MNKICSKCKIEKDLKEFCFHKAKNIPFAECRICNNIRNNEYKLKNKEKIKKSKQIYRNTEHGKNVEKLYYLRNKDRLRKYSEEKRKTKEYKKYISKWMTNHAKNRKKHDIHFRNKCLITSYLINNLRKFNKTKNNKTLDYLGCDLDFFIKYLESLFLNGMNWENQGRNGWHIGHIIPCELFDLSNEKEISKCFNYRNLKPQWEIENISQGDLLPNGERARNISPEFKQQKRIEIYGKDIIIL